ncbi:hypothetical protein BDW74DRAFT_107580 [Aspergillus multicolor]|uniref:uncharacterized protein n=1 Tax=Aspergillus multicolor TaxID=41759 RepID=UPI003CCD30B8
MVYLLRALRLGSSILAIYLTDRRVTRHELGWLTPSCAFIWFFRLASLSFSCVIVLSGWWRWACILLLSIRVLFTFVMVFLFSFFLHIHGQ